MTSDRTEEHRQLRAVARVFTQREVAPHIEAWERAGELPRSLHQRAADAGILGVGYPEDAGGAGGDFLDLMVVLEEILTAGGSSGLCASLFTHLISIPHILASGHREHIERWVRPTLQGRLIGSLAITEPETGSDVAGIRTRARRDGECFVVDGAKTFITSGVRADFVTMAVRTGGPGHGGLSLLVIEKGTPGFSVSRKLEKMGWACSDTAELSFVGARVPASHLVGKEGSGFEQIVQQFVSERLMLAVHAYGTATRSLELALSWARTREAFGRPLSANQVIRHKLAEMARQADVAREYTWAVARRFVAGENVAQQAAMAKNTAVYACDFVVNEAVQIHGGMGYMRESEVERLYRDARILGIGGGTNEIMNEIIAKNLGL